MLHDLKILDFTTLLPGPYATLMLADMGAQVIKISSPKRKDLVLEYEPFIEGTDLSANEAWLGRGKRNIYMDLKHPQAKEIVKKLIMDYDIVIEQFRPGVMKRLGLGYEDLRAVNPGIIYCSLTGYGQTGPMADRAGHDCNYMARSGNLSMAGYVKSGPAPTNMQIADICCGSMNSVIGILAAVHHRALTGEGEYIDVSMLDGLIPLTGMDGVRFLTTGHETGREEGRLGGGSVYGYYETKDGRYLSVGSLEPKFWETFCGAIGCPELTEGGPMPADVRKVREKVSGIILSKTLAEWTEIFKDKDCCVEPVSSLREALDDDEQIREREMVWDLPLAGDEKRRVRQPGFPIRFSNKPVRGREAGAPLGAHTRQVLEEYGYDYESLKRSGALGL